MSRLLSLLAALALVPGCVHKPAALDTLAISAFQPGITTLADFERVLGPARSDLTSSFAGHEDTRDWGPDLGLWTFEFSAEGVLRSCCEGPLPFGIDETTAAKRGFPRVAHVRSELADSFRLGTTQAEVLRAWGPIDSAEVSPDGGYALHWRTDDGGWMVTYTNAARLRDKQHSFAVRRLRARATPLGRETVASRGPAARARRAESSGIT